MVNARSLGVKKVAVSGKPLMSQGLKQAATIVNSPSRENQVLTGQSVRLNRKCKSKTLSGCW